MRPATAAARIILTVDSVDLIISEIHLTKMEGPRARVGADGTALLRVTGTIVTRARRGAHGVALQSHLPRR
jgi:hypothetical protein